MQLSGESLAFAQLVEYVKEVRCDTAAAPIFKQCELAKMYQARLQQIIPSMGSRVNATISKGQSLLHFPTMRGQSHVVSRYCWHSMQI